MIDLKNTTFIIPVRIESADRMRNVITILCYLLENFDTNIILKEVDTKSVYEEEVFPQIKDFLGDKLDNLNHIFEYSDDPVFYRMNIINEMISISNTEVISNYDGDILMRPETIIESVNMIQNGYDIVYPYGFGQYQKMIFADDNLVSDFISYEYDFSILERKSKDWDAQYGHVQFMNKSSYIEAGMENENFRGSSPEDKERYYRFEKLGYKVGRLNHLVYHLEHSRGNNSWPNSVQGNPYYNDNERLWEMIQKMNVEQLKNYYSTQNYLKKYK